MSSVIPEKIDQNMLDMIESSLTASNLDDLLEASLSQLLSVDHVKKAEILLLNKRNKLIPVATARNVGSNSKVKHEVMSQSWFLDSTVEHTRIRTKFAKVSPAFAIPLMESRGLLGFLNIHLDKLRVVEKNELTKYYLFGVQIAHKIKEIMLMHEIYDLKDRLQTVTLSNKEIQQQVTSLSKELYAICSVSTKINQSMDFDKSLRKTMPPTRKIFGAAIILCYTKNCETSKPQLSAVDSEDGTAKSTLLKNIEKKYLKEAFTSGKPFVKEYKPLNHEAGPVSTGEGELKTIISVPLKSKGNIIGAIILLHESMEPFNPAKLRLLSGVANIMAMGIDNMNLFQQCKQKKSEAEFLVRSIIRFNDSLNLKKILKSVTKKGVEFFGHDCRVFLFSDTQVPMIKAKYINRRGKYIIESKFFKNIIPKEINLC